MCKSKAEKVKRDWGKKKTRNIEEGTGGECGEFQTEDDTTSRKRSKEKGPFSSKGKRNLTLGGYHQSAKKGSGCALAGKNLGLIGVEKSLLC